MVELADTLDLGSSVPDVQVQVLSSAVYGAKSNLSGSGFVPFFVSENDNPNLDLIEDSFGFFCMMASSFPALALPSFTGAR